jgi:hypothetical protein
MATFNECLNARNTHASYFITAPGSTGQINFVTGTVPATADTAATGTLVCSCALSATDATVSSGTLTFNAISVGTVVSAGTITYARVYSSTAITASFLDLDVGTTATNSVSLSSTVYAIGDKITLGPTLTIVF